MRRGAAYVVTTVAVADGSGSAGIAPSARSHTAIAVSTDCGPCESARLRWPRQKPSSIPALDLGGHPGSLVVVRAATRSIS
jgi:hypothetical protein